MAHQQPLLPPGSAHSEKVSPGTSTISDIHTSMKKERSIIFYFSHKGRRAVKVIAAGVLFSADTFQPRQDLVPTRNIPSETLSSKRGPQTTSIHITWLLVRTAGSAESEPAF